MWSKRLLKKMVGPVLAVLMTAGAARGDTLPTELLLLDLQGPGIMVRESPSKRSLGQTTITPPSGGGSTYQLSSFFDIFTEISLDGGISWSPSSDGQLDLTGHSSDGTHFDTEITGLHFPTSPVSGNPALQLDPIHVSPGTTTVESSGGQFQINSFFDIFTELSLDGGSTWTPQPAATLSLNVPDGVSTMSMMLFSCGLLIGLQLAQRRLMA